MDKLWNDLYRVDAGVDYFELFSVIPTTNYTRLFLSCAGGYLAVIVSLYLLMRNRKPFDLRHLLILWNGLLSFLSLVGALIIVPFTIHQIRKLGYTAFCCSTEWYSVYSVNVVIALFCWSKIAELLDTVFLALRKREIMLLHWFHHVTVLLFVWWSSHNNVKAMGVIFAAMNLVVHFIMYGYYALAAAGFRPPFPISITLLQLAQMLNGTYTVIITWPCSNHLTTTYAALAMYFSYFVLFLLFFLNRYVFTGKSTAQPRGVRDSAETRVNKFKVH